MDITFQIDDDYELERQLWSGARDTWENIQRAGKTEEAFRFLEEVFYDYQPTITEVNDFLWFESDMIYKALGLNEEGVEEDEL